MEPQTFDQYWLAYLAGHSKPMTRLVHYLGLFFAPLAGIAASVFVIWWAFVLITPVFYLAALLTHPLLEHNSNKPFADRPLWSAIALLRMLALDMTGRLSLQLRRLDLPEPASGPVTIAINSVCVAILALAAAFHFYWAFGGRVGFGVSIPQREDGRPVINPGPAAASIVAILLTAALVVFLAFCEVIALPISKSLLRIAVSLFALVFLARALSWQRYIGFFKQVRDTRFAKYDTLFYSPVCLLLGLGFACVAWLAGP